MRVVLVGLLILTAAMAGCAEKKDDDGGDGPSGTSTSTASGSKSGTSTGSTTGTGTGSVSHSATLAADETNGTAPLSINFTMTADPGATSWFLAFGDGSSDNGTGEPATANHTYSVGGNFSASLRVVYSDGPNATASVNITVAVPGPSGPAPETHFEFGESAGCAADAHAAEPTVPVNCISFHAGPDAPAVDGHWLALDERYWGMTLTSTMEESSGLNADSDCFFMAPDHTTIIGDGHNGGGLCAGVVPEGTGWLYIYPWAFPADAMTADFA
jgi:hypothetical protein